MRKIVAASQPYREPLPVINPLRVLRELVNMDKHRDLAIANYSVDDFRIAKHDLCEVVSTAVFIKEMVPGATVARAHLLLNQPVKGKELLEVGFQIEFGETIQIPLYSNRMDLRQAMRGIIACVADILDGLETAGC